MSRVTTCAFASCVFFTACSPVQAEEANETLPPGAVARLGTYRFFHGGNIKAVAVSPDGTLLASGGGVDGGNEGRISIWDMASGRRISQLKTPDYYVISLSFSPDGKLLAACFSREIG